MATEIDRQAKFSTPSAPHREPCQEGAAWRIACIYFAIGIVLLGTMHPAAGVCEKGIPCVQCKHTGKFLLLLLGAPAAEAAFCSELAVWER